MTTIILFHHVQGLTPGVREFADALGGAGHEVVVPDLFEGRTFSSVEEGMRFVAELGSSEILERAEEAAEPVDGEVVFAGFSLGAFAAQYLAQTHAEARGALLYHGGVPVGVFGTPWPDGLPAQVHVMSGDAWCPKGEYGPFVRGSGAELFLYEGAGHLFADSGLEAYDRAATEEVVARSLEFLQRR